MDLKGTVLVRDGVVKCILFKGINRSVSWGRGGKELCLTTKYFQE